MKYKHQQAIDEFREKFLDENGEWGEIKVVSEKFYKKNNTQGLKGNFVNTRNVTISDMEQFLDEQLTKKEEEVVFEAGVIFVDWGRTELRKHMDPRIAIAFEDKFIRQLKTQTKK